MPPRSHLAWLAEFNHEKINVLELDPGWLVAQNSLFIQAMMDAEFMYARQERII